MNDLGDEAYSPELREFSSVFQQFIGAVFRLNGQLLQTADRLSADLDISTGRWQAIATIRNQPLTVSQMARRIGVTRQSARQTVQKLQQAGLVELKDNPDHRRASLVELTLQGRAVMATLFQRQELLTRLFTEGMGVDVADIRELSRQLDAMCDQATLNESDERLASG